MTSLTPQLLLALALFAFVNSITPGPNNTMLMASGANFGFRATVPHLSGVAIGFGVMVMAVGLGLGGLFIAFPWLHDILAVAGGVYMIWLAWRIATSKGPAGAQAGGQPQTFWQAAAFQWVNPKAWAMAVGAITTYAPAEHYSLNVLLVALVFMAVNAPSVTIWTAFGVGLRRFLDRPAVLKAFNITMAVLLLTSLIPLAMELAA
ncbi:MAG: LysE family translocator [Phenylobacterium sp.]|uniref:LysE family translocator n=1 Tax=Phenylobacterium sp. TaxID=1871053 RepID=UPI001B5F8C11|nr:LysE family translocator [Phenylobacterium sp.]MBP7651491.1 LysE family translocator [Phenylobacterium sp.]MBP7815151.1 LysE family translocator [Phenylobacterium sp.]MBP9754981.1 LysE family translocator [Phenylobacterium sp.]